MVCVDKPFHSEPLCCTSACHIKHEFMWNGLETKRETSSRLASFWATHVKMCLPHRFVLGILYFGRRRSSSYRRRRRSSSSRRRRSYNAGSKRFSQVQQGSKRFNVCASSNRTDGPPRTPLKGSPPLKRFGSGSGSTDSPVRYEPPRFLLLLETCLSGFSGSCCHLTCESPL